MGYRCGFTLVESAFVLAIIGLLIGGVLLAREQLRSAQVQSVISDFSKYSNAVVQFRQQYGGPPGDILDATNYWGDDAAVCADAGITDGSPGTCSGDGDGDMSDSAEPYRAWQQLVLAGYIQGNFTGIASGGGAVPGTNIPKSRAGLGGWSFGNNTASVGNTDWYAKDLGNFIVIGGTISGGLTQGALFKTDEAWLLDKKLDDGKPASGRAVALKPSPSTIAPNCSDDATDANADYKLTYTEIACSLHISLGVK